MISLKYHAIVMKYFVILYVRYYWISLLNVLLSNNVKLNY